MVCNMNGNNLLRFLLGVLCCCHGHWALTTSQLYPFGTQDEQLTKDVDVDVSSIEYLLSVPIAFYDSKFSSIFINDNGLLSFSVKITQFFNTEFPLKFWLIAPLYSQVDITRHGDVFYRETREKELLDRATQDVVRHFSEGKLFRAESLFIATWHQVARSSKNDDQLKNTVQVTIASNHTDSYCFFLYPEAGIQWVNIESSINAHPSVFAQAGFVSADGPYYILPGSGSEQVLSYPRMSNVNRRGMFAFKIGGTGANKNIKLPDKDNEDSLEDKTPETCDTTWSPCLPGSSCTTYPTGICCRCAAGQYGNGRQCIQPDGYARVNGKLTAHLNNELHVRDAKVFAYVEMKAGRVYATVSELGPAPGYMLQPITMIMGTTVSWLFAVPMGNATNGFSLTTGVFNRTVELSFPQTGHHVMITEQYKGLDIFQTLNFQVEAIGTIPSIVRNSSLNIEDYTQEIIHVSPGLIKSRLSHSFRIGDSRDSLQMIIDSTTHFEDCAHKPFAAENVEAHLHMSRNHLAHDETHNTVRHTSDSRISILAEKNVCSTVKCGAQSTCLVMGDGYRCVCNHGFEPIDKQELQPVCVDVDECVKHNCHAYAQCHNEPGSFRCTCLEGYVGDGYYCAKAENVCNNIQCAANAHCIQTKNIGPRCLCDEGYYGNGQTSCQRFETDSDDCRTISLCDLKAECKMNRLTGKYACVCQAGYRGDGILCTEESESCDKKRNCGANADCVSDETSNNGYYCRCNQGYVGDGYTCVAEINSDDCKLLNNCHRHASCIEKYPAIYECRCNAGFNGDGYKCYNATVNNACHYSQDCSAHAECISDPIVGGSVCKCSRGYVGNGLVCTKTNECNPNNNECDASANCVFNSQTSKFECVCRAGYHGDGLKCYADDGVDCNIVNDCHANASCVIEPHSLKYYCRCKLGFEGDGKTCKEHLSCDKLNNCDVKAQCSLVPGGNYQCQCLAGFVGDGFQCRPRVSCRQDRSICDANADCIYIDHLKDHTCHCYHGFIGDGYQCLRAPEHEGDYLLFSQGSSILRMPIDDSGKPGFPLIIKASQTIVGLEVDCLDGYIYWSDIVKGKIHKAPLNGSQSETLPTYYVENSITAPEGLAIDWVSRNIYWTDSHRRTIEVSNLDGSLHKVLINDGLLNPRGIAVHPGSGKLFWSDWSRENPKIEFANLDGSKRATFVETDLKIPNNLLIDHDHNDLCWGDSLTHRVECINLYTRSRRMIYAQASYPFDLAISQNNIYWTDWDTRSIHRIDRNGGAATKLDVPLGGHGKLYSIVNVPRQCPRISNACATNNGGCKHLCLPNDRGRTCACPDDSYDEDSDSICNKV